MPALRSTAQRLAAAASRLNAGRALGRAAPPTTLAFLTDRVRVPAPDVVIRALPAGAGVIFRDYGAPRRRGDAFRLAAIARQRGARFFVAGDAALAVACGADGVHLPSRLLRQTSRRPGGLFVSCACHSAADVEAANRIGVDLVLISPVFDTLSHPGAPALGRERLARLTALADAPALALGGIDAATASALVGTGVAGFGAIGAFIVDGSSGLR